MNFVPLILARGSSKGVYKKNIANCGNIPLIAHNIKVAIEAFGKCFVQTDDNEIKEVSEEYGATVYLVNHINDSQSSMRGIHKFLATRDESFDFLIHLQCTSPLTSTADLLKATQKMVDTPELNSLVTLVKNAKSFQWEKLDDGTVRPVRHPLGKRKRRQEFGDTFFESGNFYVLRSSAYNKSLGHILTEPVGYIEVDSINKVQVDDQADLTFLDRYLKVKEVTKQPDVNVIAEIGINHNGSLELCKDMMKNIRLAGGKYVKLQKRDPNLCVPDHMKNNKKKTPWGEMTYLEYKKKIEFDVLDMKELFMFAKELGLILFSSVFDIKSAMLMKGFTSMVKIPSCCITDLELLDYCRKNFKFMIISTGMSTEEQIRTAISYKPDVVMACCSSYPAKPKDLNLKYITWIQDKYPNVIPGYSGHELELETTIAAVALGAVWVERHVTLDRTYWGSDQSSSLEIQELAKLIGQIKTVTKALDGYRPREIQELELEKLKTLRK